MFYCEESDPSYVLTTESTIQSVRSTRRQCSYPWNVPFDRAYSSALDAGRVIPAVITSFPRRRESGCAVLRRLSMRARLPRPPRRPGAEERRARGDEQAASKEEE